MSSHREAPEISKDPVADNTDVYAFVSPGRPDTATLIANFIPLQQPDGGPNFYEFGDDVLYQIHVANRGNARSDVVYQFRFQTTIRNRKTFLYNTGQINDIHDTTWNRPQYYTVTRVKNGASTVLATGLRTPPVNVGRRSTPNYPALANQATYANIHGHQIFAGQRTDAFHVDLGSIFDLGGLRPLNQAHLIKLPTMSGVNSVDTYNVHTIAIQVPISEISRHGNRPSDADDHSSSIGVWATASRRKSRVFDASSGTYVGHGPWEQVSRLGNPLFNEVITPMAEKDQWNSRNPHDDHRYATYVNHPELAGLLPYLYPGAFPHLDAYNKSGASRADLHAILLTGVPNGVVPGFAGNYTGAIEADMLRLNLAIPPSSNPNALGLLGGDVAGFPNGRRVDDDVVTIELRAVAGATLPFTSPGYQADAAVGSVSDGTAPPMGGGVSTQSRFPYLGNPGGGYETMPGTTSVQ